jgi:branched-chain amino acid transport system substrate-binding protein
MNSVMKGLLRITCICLFCIFLGVTANAESNQPIKIGVNSAWDFPGGQGVKRGANIAIMDINAEGGLLGRKVEGIIYDNKADAGGAKAATERLLYRDKVDVICGFWRSDLAILCQPLIMEAKTILLIGGGSTPVITQDRIAKDYNKYKYTFTTTSNSNYSLTRMEKGIFFAREMGLKKIALIVEKAAWAEAVYNDCLKRFKEETVYSTRFSTTATNFSVELSQAKGKGANVLFMVTTGSGGIPSVKQWYDMQIPAIYVGYNVDAQDPNFWEVTEGKAQGVVTSKIGGGAGLALTPKSIPFFEKFKSVYNEYPQAYTNVMTYDAVMAWAHGVRLAGTTDSDSVVKAMERNDFNYEGVAGKIEYFDKIHNPVGGGWKEGESWGGLIVQWQNGKQVVVWPDRFKAGEVILPERIKKLMR